MMLVNGERNVASSDNNDNHLSWVLPVVANMRVMDDLSNAEKCMNADICGYLFVAIHGVNDISHIQHV